MTDITNVSCPCGSGFSLELCCGRYHQGKLAPTPEALMRSRYSAFVLGLNDYLLATWHPSTRPKELALDTETEWKKLLIINAEKAVAESGQVHFQAYFRERHQWHVLEEISQFSYAEKRWLYVSGEPVVTRLKPGRNASCLCGSGRKIKVCCGE